MDIPFLVVWGNCGQDGSGFGDFGQRYGDLIFKNGFEQANRRLRPCDQWPS